MFERVVFGVITGNNSQRIRRHFITQTIRSAMTIATTIIIISSNIVAVAVAVAVVRAAMA